MRNFINKKARNVREGRFDKPVENIKKTEEVINPIIITPQVVEPEKIEPEVIQKPKRKKKNKK